MTPNDILNKRFDRAAVGGYRADDVNAFMLSISDYLEDVIAEKEDLQNKLIVLADKLEEYRSDEESMRSALIGAQKLGDNIVKDSKEKADKIVSDANNESEAIIRNAKNESTKITHEAKLKLETENYAINKLQREVAKFKKQILALYQQQIELIGAIPYDEANLAPPLPNPLKTNIDVMRKDAENNLESNSSDTGKERLAKDLQDNNIGEQFKKEELKFKPLEFGEGFKIRDQKQDDKGRDMKNGTGL